MPSPVFQRLRPRVRPVLPSPRACVRRLRVSYCALRCFCCGSCLHAAVVPGNGSMGRKLPGRRLPIVPVAVLSAAATTVAATVVTGATVAMAAMGEVPLAHLALLHVRRRANGGLYHGLATFLGWSFVQMHLGLRNLKYLPPPVCLSALQWV